MMVSQKLSLSEEHSISDALIEFPISTDQYLVVTYFGYHVCRSQFVYEDPIYVVLNPLLVILFTLFTLPFYFLPSKALKSTKGIHLGPVKFPVSTPNIFFEKVSQGFDPEKVKIIKWPDSRFMERSSVLGRLVFIPETVFSEGNMERENNLAQLHHDIGHSINYDYIYEKAAAFVIVDMIFFYFVFGWKFSFNTAVGVWVELVFSLFIFFSVVRYSKFLHAREYRADLYGYNQVGHHMVNFLKQGAMLERHFVHKSGKVKFFASLIHPTFAKRLERLTVCVPDALNCSHIKQYAKQSLFHSRLLFMVSWCSFYWSLYMFFSYVNVLIGAKEAIPRFPNTEGIIALILVNLFVILLTVWTSLIHFRKFSRMQLAMSKLRLF